MKTFIDNIAGLIQIKKLIALALTVCFFILALRGSIDTQSFLTVFLVIIGFYYGQSTANNSTVSGTTAICPLQQATNSPVTTTVNQGATSPSDSPST